MCGLVGAAGIMNKEARHAFRMMLQLDTIRGPHSTGVFMARKKGKNNLGLYKSLGTPWDFMRENYENFSTKGVPDDGAYLLIGHNRYATIGEITTDNAHPFWIDHIAGAHNGTLLKGWENKLLPGDFAVDSESLFNTLAAEGVDYMYSKLSGAAALTWYNDKDGTLNLLRNKERPLTFAFTKDKKAIFWASEAWMIRESLSSYGVEFDDVMSINPDYHLVVDLKQGQSNPEQVSFTKLTPCPPPPKQKSKPYTYPARPKLVSPLLTPKGGKKNTTPKIQLYDSSELSVAKDMVGKSCGFYLDDVNPKDPTVFYGHTLDDHIKVRIKFTDKEEQARKYFTAEHQTGWFIGIPSFVGFGDNTDTITLNILPINITQLIEWSDYPITGDINKWMVEQDLLTLTDASFIMDYEDEPTYYIGNQQVEASHAQKILDVGCGWCSHKEDLDNWVDIRIIENNTYLCSDCANDKGVLQHCGQTYY